MGSSRRANTSIAFIIRWGIVLAVMNNTMIPPGYIGSRLRDSVQCCVLALDWSSRLCLIFFWTDVRRVLGCQLLNCIPFTRNCIPNKWSFQVIRDLNKLLPVRRIEKSIWAVLLPHPITLACIFCKLRAFISISFSMDSCQQERI